MTEGQPKKNSRNASMLIIFMTVFIDLLGFGIIIPLTPYLARHFSASPFQIGFLMSIYSIMQFLFSPFWGGWSDKIGRRPIILLSLLGGAGSYLVFGFATNFWTLVVARGLAGLFGGNISAAHAYIADITTEKDRSKGMGMLGAAFGLGFIFGPLIGGLLGIWGQSLGAEPPFGVSFSAIGAALFCLLNFTFAYFKLGESLDKTKASESHAESSRFKHIWQVMRRPIMGPLILSYLLSGLAMSQMESMLIPYMSDTFGWDMRTSSYGFAYIGVIMVITQGMLIRKMTAKFGDPLTLSAGLILFALSLAAIPMSPTIAAMGVAMTVLAVGNGFIRPPNLSMVSKLSSSDQGMTMGVANSMAALGRIFGPVFGGFCYQHFGKSVPFFSASILVVLGYLVLLPVFAKLPGRKNVDLQVVESKASQ